MKVLQLKKKIYPMLKKHDVQHASLFGSVAKGMATKDSDIDLLIQFKGEKGLFDLAALKLDLERLLSKKIDLVTKNALNPRLKKEIFKDKIKIF